MQDPNHRRCTTLLPAAKNDGYQVDHLDYPKVRMMAIAGRFPAFQINQIWHFDRREMPAIAEALGLARVASCGSAAQQHAA